jgi:hypothetical protein
MAYFLCKLIPPRKTFPGDMSDSECLLMQQHAKYWTERMGEGVALLFGPVSDPEGPYGLAVLSLDRDADPQGAAAKLCQQDPVNLGGVGFTFQIFPMPAVIHPHP